MMSIHSGTIPFSIVGQSGRVQPDWVTVDSCPACGSRSVTASARLPDAHYAFGGQKIPIPGSGITVNRCGACAIHFKSVVPSNAFLAEMFERHAEEKWTVPHDFSRELSVVREMWGAPSMDLLDIGAAGGALLEAHAAAGLAGRRSALDVLRYAGVGTHLRGEFIEGFLDTPAIRWSGAPYDVVTLFDVVEHFYRPRDAFDNLRQLTRVGGLVFIESGNIESYWPRRFGINEWWYVRLLEHHIFWSRPSLEHMAASHGFSIVYWREVRHKGRTDRKLPGVAADLLKSSLYCIAGRKYSRIARALGRQGNQPWFPFVHDHFRACLMRN